MYRGHPTVRDGKEIIPAPGLGRIHFDILDELSKELGFETPSEYLRTCRSAKGKASVRELIKAKCDYNLVR